MSALRRLTVMLAAAALAAAAGAAPAAECHASHNKTCANTGAHCGTRQEPGVCQTLYHRAWRQTEISCVCRPTHPPHHGGVAVP